MTVKAGILGVRTNVVECLENVSRSVVSDSETLWTAAHQASLSFIITQSLLKFTSIESEIPSNHLVLCHPLLLLPSVFPSIRVFLSLVNTMG